MHLIEILLPLSDNDGAPFAAAEFRRVSDELTERFGGLTAFNRAPAEGLWKDGSEGASRDEIVIFEVMADEIDRNWWKTYRADLEERFRQDRIVIRAQTIEQF